MELASTGPRTGHEPGNMGLPFKGQLEIPGSPVFSFRAMGLEPNRWIGGYPVSHKIQGNTFLSFSSIEAIKSDRYYTGPPRTMTRNKKVAANIYGWGCPSHLPRVLIKHNSTAGLEPSGPVVKGWQPRRTTNPNHELYRTFGTKGPTREKQRSKGRPL